MEEEKKSRGERPPPRRRPPWYTRIPIPYFQRLRSKYDEVGTRHIFINNPGRNRQFRYSGNKVTTSKYTLLSFVPINLYEQFKRLANFWFLVVACLQLIPNISPISPITSFAPLIFVLSITAIKELFEDWKRRVQDREVNNQPVTVTRGGASLQLAWRDVQVGDIVRVNKNEGVPADLVILSSSDEMGACYVETAAIDGETNLKLRQALKNTCDLGNNVSGFQGVIECEKPNNRLYNFSGTLEIPGQEKIPLSLKQFLFRGCVLRNTDWVQGAVVFTGHETKLMRNNTQTKLKRSQLEKDVDKGVLQLMLFVVLLCFLCGLLDGLFVRFIGLDHWYLDLGNSFFGSPALIGVRGWVTFLILYSVMIPISLYVSMEIVKVILAFWIEQDIKMYHAETNTPAKARTSNLAEQLGQIEYIFSDKTGTLTSNQMDFQRCTIGGTTYGTLKPAEQKDEETLELNDASGPINTQTAAGEFRFDDPRLLDNLRAGGPDTQAIELFFVLLAACHTVIVESEDGGLSYQASSPDEAALVLAANKLGFVFLRRTHDHITISVQGKEQEYHVLNILEFNSDRKRMSVIVRCPDGRIRLFCKGADNMILARLGKHDGDPVVGTTKDHLQEFATQGLRTLCCAYTELSEEEYAAWNKKYYEASISIENRDEKVDAVSEEIERDLMLIGATAIEDKLQDGVPETIENLQKANIKIWVLTGDKEETAINIGYSANLLQEDMLRILLNAENCPDKTATLNNLNDGINMAKNRGDKRAALVIDGHTMDQIFGDAQMEQKLYELGSHCISVICCRSSPLQKALIVRLVKNAEKAQCLAIGDGANDVPMIQAAQIGVGISGKEGLQACNASDYSIAQFRYLQRLVLIHGRWNYKRLSKLFLYCFYKNMAVSLTQFWFAWFSGMSGQTIYDSWPIALYNTLFTSAPIVVFAVFDQDVSAQKVEEYPQLYESGQKNHEFSLKLLWAWIGFGIYQSIVIFFITFFTYYRGTTQLDGTVADLFSAGTTAYTAMIVIVNFVLMLEFNYWVVWSHVFAWGSILIWFLFMLVYQLFPINQNEMYHITFNLWGSPTYWLTVLCVTVISILPFLCYKVFRRNMYPENFHIIQEQMYLGIHSNPKKKSFGRRMVDGLYTGFAFSKRK